MTTTLCADSRFFAPDPSTAATMKKIAGTGSYADSRGPADMSLDAAKKYKDYGWALNWDSTARFPWHGEWLPTAADGFGESWLTCFAHGPPDQHTNEGCKTVSYAEIDSWYRHINKMGAAVGTEFSSCQYGTPQDSRWDLTQDSSGRLAAGREPL